jgi:oxygen-dependent protoporphyrinogen oxidase
MTAGERRPVVAIAGGGLSGLAAAWALAQSGEVRVVLIDAAPRLGGKVTIGRLAGRPIELGPDQFLRRDPSLEQLCRALGLGPELVAPAGSGAGVWSYGRLRALPRGLVLGVPTDWDAVAASGIVSATGVAAARAAAERSRGEPAVTAEEVGLGPGHERSAGEVLRPRLGDEVVDRLVDPLLGGINAGGVDSLSLGTVAPQIARAIVGRSDLANALQAAPGAAPTIGPETGSPFFGLRGGLYRVVEALTTQLVRLRVEVRNEVSVDAITAADDLEALEQGQLSVHCSDRSVLAVDGVVAAVPGQQLATMLDGLSESAAAAARSVDYAGVAVATFQFGARDLPAGPGWTGFLVPRVEGRLMTAVTYLSDKWPWMGDDSVRLVRVSAGRHNDDRALRLTDDELLAALGSELAEIAGITAAPLDTAVTRWEGSFPQYRPGHARIVEQLEAGLAHLPQLQLAGALLGGIGMPACVSSGQEAAERVLAALRR